MATTNVTVTSAWTKIADDTDDPFLAQPTESCLWEWATVATETAPTVTGHKVAQKLEEPERVTTALSRDLAGAGFVYAKTLDVASMVFAVTK